MAITKLMNITEGSHLNNSIEYIENNEKTKRIEHLSNLIEYAGEKTNLIGSCNCVAEDAYEEFMQTKKEFGKEGGRQAYHFIISFKPGEATDMQAYKIVSEFCQSYLKDYESIYAIHTDQEHIHGHIIFNSVSFIDGLKYHYNDGDWEKYIQPVVDSLCIQNGVPPLEYHLDTWTDKDGNVHEKKTYPKNYNWNDVIRADIDELIPMSKDLNDLLDKLKETKNYRINGINHGKYIVVKAPGMKKGRRLKAKSIGKMYSEDAITLRLAVRNHTSIAKEVIERTPCPDRIKVSKGHVKHKKWVNMNPYEKQQFKNLMLRMGMYRIGPKKKWQKETRITYIKRACNNLDYVCKNKFDSEKAVLKKLNEINEERGGQYEKLNEIKLKMEALKMETDFNDLNSSSYYSNNLAELELAKKEVLKNLSSLSKEHKMALNVLSEKTQELVGTYTQLRKEEKMLMQSIKKSNDKS